LIVVAPLRATMDAEIMGGPDEPGHDVFNMAMVINLKRATDHPA
jgi:hypothetical protein